MPSSKAVPARRKALRVQADIPHTFGPLLVPMAGILVFWGGYMLERAIAHPLESDAAPVLFGSFILACGLLVLSSLLRSLRVSAVHHSHQNVRPVEISLALRASPRAQVAAKSAALPRPFHRFYVDDTRISR